MKIAVQKIIVVLVLLTSQFLMAQTPPPPTPPPGFPIDGGIVALFFAALVLGYIVTKRYLFTKKSSL